MQYLIDNPVSGWEPQDVEQAFAISHRIAELLANNDTEERQNMSREVLVFSRAEVNEEALQGADYGRTKTRVNYYVRVDYVEGARTKSYVCNLQHFLRVPHPSCNFTRSGEAIIKPLRVAMATFYQPRTGNPPRTVHVNTTQTKGEYYAVDPRAIMYKYVVAFPRGRDDDKELYCMTYHGLTGNR